MTDRTIFRESAIAAYRRGTDKDTLPRLTSWPTIALFWLLLAGSVVAAVLAWSVRVPTYLAASGVILARAAPPAPANNGSAASGTRAALFVPPDQSHRIRLGQSVHGQIGSSGAYVAGMVRRIEADVIGPTAIRHRYPLAGSSEVPTNPSRVVVVEIRRTLPPAAYAGSRWTANVRVGSQRLLSFFPGLG